MDDKDYVAISKYKWYAKRCKGLLYAARHDASLREIYMHQMIFGVKWCDHANRNSLDNRRNNLRKASRSQQNCNRKMQKNNTSGYKGVSFAEGYWRAQIWQGQRIHLGYYKTKEEAARAYDEAAKKLHGEFAVLNY